MKALTWRTPIPSNVFGRHTLLSENFYIKIDKWMTKASIIKDNIDSTN